MSEGQAARVPANPPTRAATAPPPEVVLPAPYYAALLLEVAALIALHTLSPEESGGAKWSYALGWAGTISMLVMHVYSIRKRVRALKDVGRLRTWLQVHIFLGLQGALFVTYHSLHLHDAKSIQGINILCVAIVVASGIFGRYVYAFIPKSLAGERLTAVEIEKEMAALAGAGQAAPTPELAAAAAAYEQGSKLTGRVSFGTLVSEDLRARKALRQLERELRDRATQLLLAKQTEREDRERIEAFVRVARRRVLLARRLATFAAADRLFRTWSILHKPLTFLLLGATILHVIAHYMYTAGMSG